MTSIVLPGGERYELRGGALSGAGVPPSTSRIAYAAAHVVAGEPFPWDFAAAARGVQLAELGLRAASEGRRIEIPELT